MRVRALEMDDIEKLRELHEQFFKDQFAFPDFVNGFLTAFVVTDDNDKIIVGGGVRAIAEAVLITDIDAPRVTVGRSLHESYKVSKYLCEKFGYSSLHAFVHKYTYERHLRLRGFTSVKGSALVLDI